MVRRKQTVIRQLSKRIFVLLPGVMFEQFVEAVGDRFPNIVIQDETTVQTEQAIYTIVARLGEGGQGSVFGARVERLLTKFPNNGIEVGALVAIKIQDQISGRRENEILERLLNLKNACDTVSCIVDAYIDDETQQVFTVIRLYPFSQDARKIIETLNTVSRNRATRLVRIAIIQQMLTNIDAIHEQDVFHIDIKPANLVVTFEDPEDPDDFAEEWTRVAIMDTSQVVYMSKDDSPLDQYVRLRNATVAIPNEQEVELVTLFVIEKMIVRFIDFGFAVVSDESFDRNGKAPLVGTVLFMDPWYIATVAIQQSGERAPTMLEMYPVQKDDDGNVRNSADEKARWVWRNVDTWSLGITAYTIYWGFPPIEETTDQPSDESSTVLERLVAFPRASTDQYAFLEHFFNDLKPLINDNLLEKFTGVNQPQDIESSLAMLAVRSFIPLKTFMGCCDVTFPGFETQAQINSAQNQLQTIQNRQNNLNVAYRAFLSSIQPGQFENEQENFTEALQQVKQQVADQQEYIENLKLLFEESYAIQPIESLLEVYPPDRNFNAEAINSALAKQYSYVYP
jgi:serine/threonine protein kinase